MFTKQNIHKLYLLVSAFVVLHGIMSRGWSFNVGALKTFTLLSNYLVIIGFLLMLVLYNSKSEVRSYLSVCVIVSISVTALVYNFVLVPFSRINMFFSNYLNFVTHFLSTILVLFNYFFFEKKGTFTFKHILAGMVFPFTYWVVFVSIGDIIGFYPYFFMNPKEIGWVMTFIWFGIILFIVTVLGFLLILFDRSRAKK